MAICSGWTSSPSGGRFSAWKTYTQFGPEGRGYFLSDAPGVAMIEKARKTGNQDRLRAQGHPFSGGAATSIRCATTSASSRRAFADVKFLIYHSGFVPGQPEGPYEAGHNEGIDSLVTSLAKNSVKTRLERLRGARIDMAFSSCAIRPAPAHTIGKLVNAVGEDKRALGHRQHLVRLAAGPDRRISHVPDRAGTARQAPLCRAHGRRSSARFSA